jgi:hypothetical protein
MPLLLPYPGCNAAFLRSKRKGTIMVVKSRTCWMIVPTLFALCVAFLPACYADDDVLPPKGEYANIDVALCNKTINVLLSGTDEEKEAMVKEILAAPENYAPAVFCVLSDVLLNKDRKDEAAFWYHAGLLRSQYDANRCADVSAREGVGILAMKYGPAVMEYVLQDPAKWETLISEVVEWDKKTPHNYDGRWINLHGMNAVLESTVGDQRTGKAPELSLPKDQWEAIAEKTRTDFEKAFHEVIEQMKNNKGTDSIPKLLEQLKSNPDGESVKKILDQMDTKQDKAE